MKLRSLLLGGVVIVALVGVAYVGQKAEQNTASQMTSAAEKFLGTLTAEQKAKAVLSFDSAERTNWHFVPLEQNKKPTRKGLALQDMNAEQRKAALELLKTGTSLSGYEKATTIMTLEGILRDLEKGRGLTRNPDWYFFTIFGDPSKTGQWGWRVEGHHLSLNFTLDKGKVTGSTPAFFGANPATVRGGPRKGYQTLAGAENLARELFNALDDEQKKVALQKDQFKEIEQAKTKPNVGPPVGLPVAKMNDKQRELLLKLLNAYTSRMPAEVAEVEMAKVKKAGLDKIHFAFAHEPTKPGSPYTYRVQGPTFIVEFLNTQADGSGNPANHVHSSWRNLQGDFGLAAK